MSLKARRFFCCPAAATTASSGEQLAAVQLQVQQPIAEVTTLRDDKAVLQGAASVPRTELEQVRSGVAAFTAGLGTGTGRNSVLFDIQGLGKPEGFDSTDHAKLPTWRLRFNNFICGASEKAEESLARARAKEGPIAASLVESELGAD